MWQFLAKLFGAGAGTVIDAGTGMVKTIWGDKAAREAAIASEQTSILEQFAAEFTARQQRTWWDSLVDGVNRLPRPALVIGVHASFVWAAADPVGFTECMTALATVPENLWLVWLTIVGFFFGGRIIENAPKVWKVDPKMLDLAKQIAADRAERRAAETAKPTQIIPETIPAPIEVDSAPENYNSPDGMIQTVSSNADTDLLAVAATIWGEARSEPREGKIAVGWVIRNRARQPGWWGSGYRGVCLASGQFTCWWDKQGPRVRSVDESDPQFVEALDIAGKVIAGILSDSTGGADHYYADTIAAPKWAAGRQPTIVIGHHRFFRLGLRGQG